MLCLLVIYRLIRLICKFNFALHFFLYPYFLNLLLHLHQCIRAMVTVFADYESKSKS